MGNYILILLVLLSLALVCTTSLKYCYEGTYEVEMEDGYLACDLCPEGTYMPEYDHRHRACYNCTKTDSYLEVVVSPCTRRRDTIIHCVEGYYRDLPRNPREKATCKKCTDCQFTGRACQNFSDAICCFDENFDVLPDKNGYPLCRERPWFCMKGQYFTASTCKCQSCPSNTYMPLDYHVMTECFRCPEYFIPNHSEIIHQCNSTHPPVVACEHGFYKDHFMSYKKDAVGCRRCTDCSMSDDGPYIGRQCNRDQNTVCCSQPNTTVVDTPDGPRCSVLTTVEATSTSTSRPGILFCGTDQYLHINHKTNSVACHPCPDGTYMDKTDHRETSCKTFAKNVRGTTRLLENSLEFSEKDNKNPQVTNTGADPNVYFICFVVCVILLVISFICNIILMYFRVKTSSRSFKPNSNTRSNMSSSSVVNNEYTCKREDIDVKFKEPLYPLLEPITQEAVKFCEG